MPLNNKRPLLLQGSIESPTFSGLFRRSLLIFAVGFIVNSPSVSFAGPPQVTLPPGIAENQLRLEGYPGGTHFSANGLVFLSGNSFHFNPPPEFALLSSPRRDPGKEIGYPEFDVLEAMELPNKEIYPIQIRDMKDPSISGFTVIGQQSKKLPWRVVKAMWDGDALHVKGCEGTARVHDVYWENVEDGFGPDAGLDRWELTRAWMKDIRDDAIENDDFIDGLVSDCLIDGCFVFLSQRSSPVRGHKTVTTIEDSLVRISAQPHDGIENRLRPNRF